MTNKSNIITLLLFAASAISSSAKVEVRRLTIEGRETAIGLDVEHPRFGWQIMSDKRNVMQKSYRIIVASTMDKLSKNEGDVWDSGTVATDSSQCHWRNIRGRTLFRSDAGVSN